MHWLECFNNNNSWRMLSHRLHTTFVFHWTGNEKQLMRQWLFNKNFYLIFRKIKGHRCIMLKIILFHWKNLVDEPAAHRMVNRNQFMIHLKKNIQIQKPPHCQPNIRDRSKLMVLFHKDFCKFAISQHFSMFINKILFLFSLAFD